MSFNIEYAEIIAKDYNDYINNEFNNFLTSGRFTGEADNILSIREQMKNYVSEWGCRKIPGLNNMSAKEYVESFDDFGELMKLFEYFSNNSIEMLPDFLVDKIYSFGEEAFKKFSEYMTMDIVKKDITDYKNLSQEDNNQINIVHGTMNAIIYLGNRASSLCGDVIEFMTNCHENNEFFLELGESALRNMGAEALMRVVEHINNTEIITGKEEYMLLALCDTGYKNGNDEIYKCLKNSFRRMPNKLIGAVLLGDYGDGRAVPMLRKFAIDNKGFIDENTYFGVLGAIEKLGGEIKDLLPHNIAQY